MLDCLVNGEISSLLTTSSRGVNYGDGLFETLVVDHGRPLNWQAHMERFAEGCERLGINMPPQALLLREVKTVSALGRKLVVKIVLVRNGEARGYAPAHDSDCARIVSSHIFPEDIEAVCRKGISVKICALRLATQPALGGVKHLNRLEQVLASVEIQDQDVDEGLLLDREEHLVSAISANIFLVMEGRLLTPRLDRCGVRGITRRQILSAYKAHCEQRRVHVEILPDVDEIFICNSVRGIVPVTMVDDLSYPIGPLTRELQGWFEASTKA